MDFALIPIGRSSDKGKCESGPEDGLRSAPRSQCSIRSSIVLFVLTGQGIPAVSRMRRHAAPHGPAPRWPQFYSSSWLSALRWLRNNRSQRRDRYRSDDPRRSHPLRCSRNNFRRAWSPHGTFSRSAESFPAIVPSPARSRLTVSTERLLPVPWQPRRKAPPTTPPAPHGNRSAPPPFLPPISV